MAGIRAGTQAVANIWAKIRAVAGIRAGTQAEASIRVLADISAGKGILLWQVFGLWPIYEF